MVRVNQAADWLSKRAWRRQVFGRFSLHHLAYYEIRERFGLPAHHAVAVIGKVAASYVKEDRPVPERKVHWFRVWGGISFVQGRNYTLSSDLTNISLTLLDGRHHFALKMDDRARALLSGKRGELDLILRRGKWYVQVSVEVQEAPMFAPTAWLGVDMGVVNVAVDSDGEFYGDKVLPARRRHRKLRSALQAKGSRSAKQHLKKLSGQERRLSSHTNHVISKRLVEKAQGTGRGIALEDLEGIRDRATVSKALRREVGNWAFFDLRQKVTYKALRAGVSVRLVDPRYTSQQCPACGLVDRANRPSQAVFRCTGCGESGHADHVAARNVAARVDVNPPIVSAFRTGKRQSVALRHGKTAIQSRVRHKVTTAVRQDGHGDQSYGL